LTRAARDVTVAARRRAERTAMDLRYTEDEIAFREQIRAFVRDNLPPAIRERNLKGHPTREDFVAWTGVLASKGWSVPHWPVEWGGTGWSPIKLSIFGDELQRANAPEPLPFGANMVGPVIYTFGSEAQKRRFLPGIVDLSEWWCQGFSEPGAGSDLAGLRTSARREDDSWVISGQKTWTTLAQYADWIFVLARTNPSVKKQEGISFFLVDMKSKGVTVRPIQTIDGGYEVNEVFLDDVRIPLDNIVGSENKGWDYAKFLLANERNGIARVGVSKARLARVRELAGLAAYGAGPKLDDPVFRSRLAAAEVELKALELTQMRVIAGRARVPKGQPDPLSSVLKIKGSELQQTTTELLMDVVGPYAWPSEPDDDGTLRNEPPIGPEWAGAIAPAYFNTRKVSIYGGSNEIQRGIIAKAILGL
jgi:pimeloyl-CoA dehydrogenase large subunit